MIPSEWRVVFAALVLALVGSLQRSEASAATVDSLVQGLEPLGETRDVRCFRFETRAVEPLVYVGMVLERGDRLAGVTDDLVLELACGDAVKTLLTGRFDVVIDDALTACVLDMANGNLDVLTETPTEVNVGGVVLGSEGTQYALRIGRASQLDLLVFDGKVRVQARKKDSVKSGRVLRIEAGGALGQKRGLTESDIQPSAEVYARANVAAIARQLVPNPRELFEELQALHLQVLFRPRDVSARTELATKQEEYGLIAESRYHRERSEDIRQNRVGKVFAGVAAAIGAALIVKEATDDDDVDSPNGERDACAELRRLLASGETQVARSESEGRISARRASSCDYYALGWIQFRSQQRQPACDSCRQALVAHQSDGLLLAEEVKFCDNLKCRVD